LGNAWNLFAEIAMRLGFNTIDVKYLDSNELCDALIQGNDVLSLIEGRRNGFLSIMINEYRFEITDKNFIKEVLAVVNFKEEHDKNELKGSIAYPGKITAKCKVLHKVDDMKKIERGDILVISMTDPNYLPAMEKASAFVTDFGGILCHAAIVSREMKKPCLIATKHATKVFKDGDLLELDADVGIVKKVN
jgi:phosphoenolpyruvate synthase/pyruvate phosphate dikinase